MVRLVRLTALVLTASVAFILCSIFFTDHLFITRYTSMRISPFKNNQPIATLRLIILTYRRSGSSFTGDIIQQHPDVFYVYEPLLTIERKIKGLKKYNVIRYFNNSNITAPLPGSDSETALYLSTINSLFNCTFDQLDFGTLKQIHMQQSKSTLDAFKCIRNTNSTESNWDKALKCFQNVSSNCRTAKIIAIKTVRLSMKRAEILFTSDPTVKIIHLIRDPRGVLRSRSVLGWFNFTFADTESFEFCSQVLEDIEVSKSISKKFPNRILTVRYEDIAENTVEAARQLYRFIGLDMDSLIERYIWNISNAGQLKVYHFTTVQNNSVETAYSWRSSLPYEIISAIEKSCAPLFHQMGYRLFKSPDEVTNFNISVKNNDYDPDLSKMIIENSINN